MLSVKNISLNPFNSFPNIRLSTPREILNKATMIALPVIAGLSLVYANKANAGPLAYAACMSACTAATLGAFLPACIVACTPALAAPTP